MTLRLMGWNCNLSTPLSDIPSDNDGKGDAVGDFVISDIEICCCLLKMFMEHLNILLCKLNFEVDF